MAETLEVLAKRSVVHADLKPDNILVDFDGKRITGIKLIDFGSSFLFSNEEGSKITASTPEYLAPEVLALLESKNSNSLGLCSFT
jgi:serine/threonine protein kinase